MAETGAKSMQFKAREEDFEAAYSYAESVLKDEGINDKVASESLLVFEALFQKLLDSDLGEDTTLDVSWEKRLGNLRLRIGFEGRQFLLCADGEESIEDKLLRAHDEKLDCSYRAGYNLISISVSRGYRKQLFACAIAALCAVAVYIPLRFLLDDAQRATLLWGYVTPIETIYANAVLMIGAPITFFSLLKNLTDTYVVSQRSSGIRRLQLRVVATSIVAVLLAIVAGFLWHIPFAGFEGMEPAYEGTSPARSFAEFATTLMPPSIFEPFETISPFPLMIIALLATYALCSAGKHFDTLRKAMEACYVLFSRMLSVLIAILPVFCFLAFMDVLLDSDVGTIPIILGYFGVIISSLLLLYASYAIRLRARGVKVADFARKLVPLLRENVKIGSSIDAAPYNIRYCARTYGMNREKLERNLPVLAQINLDGNSFIIMLIGLIFMFVTGMDITLLGIAGLAALVLFLSFGAPNQPGSILVGTLIVTMYLNSFELMCVAIYLEAFLGGVQNITNVIGDIVTVAIDDRVDGDKVGNAGSADGADGADNAVMADDVGNQVPLSD